MNTRIIIPAALAAIFAAPVAAQEAKTCDDETMTMVIEQVETAGEGTKEAAMTELQMAKDKMADGDAEACSLHLTNASMLAEGS